MLAAAGAPVVAGWFLHIVLFCLFFEALARRIPIEIALFPIIFYGTYYAIYFQQISHISAKSAQLVRANPGKVCLSIRRVRRW